MRLGICTSPDRLPAAHEAGFAFAELGCATLLYDQDDAAFKPVRESLLAAPRLAHIHLATPCLPELGSDGGPGYDLARFLAVLKKAGYPGRLSVEDNPGLLGKTTLPPVEAYTLVNRHVRTVEAAA